MSLLSVIPGKISGKIFKIFENYGKFRAMNALRALPESTLVDVGISPRLLAEGVRAWPWAMQQDNWEPRRSAFQKPIPATMTQVTVEVTAEREANAAA